MSADTQNIIRSLCFKELAPWLTQPVEYERALNEFDRYNATVRSIFLYRIHDRRVSLAPKPNFRVRKVYAGSLDPEEARSELPVIYREEHDRALIYRDFLQWTVRATGLDVNTTVAIDVNDAPLQRTTVPVLAFQKEVNSNTLLLPDVDFLHSYFYVPVAFRDETPYQQKSATAVFSGSTTGGRTITADDVRTLAIPRLRSGVFFKESPIVDFRLPRIIQCDSPQTEDMVRKLGVSTEYAGWRDQFRHKFVLSMDGNGATCSRVAVSLHSNCVLMKYDSPHRLYYFDHLIPWRHYIPITSDADVPGLVEAERRQPGLFEWVADEGRSFARKYLSRSSITQYTATLIRMYAASFKYASERARLSAGCLMPTATPTAESARCIPDQPLEFGGHILGRGDLWAWPDGWLGEPNTGRPIEAITIVPGADIALDCVEYRAMYGDGVWSEWCRGSSTCGTRGCDRPLKAFCVRLRGEAAARVRLTYLATFVDGSRSRLMKAGEICQAKSLAPLEAIRINAERVA